MFHSEQASVVYVMKPGDHQAGVAGDSINMGKVSKVVYLLQTAAITGDTLLTVKSGATAGTETTSETFRYRLADGDQAAASADLFGDWATSTSLTTMRCPLMTSTLTTLTTMSSTSTRTSTRWPQTCSTLRHPKSQSS